ncbi:hypothetical protein V5F29_05290 [Xanthobacter aminoxidans]|uniref:hypothetical protein n=1 Tax=Xanthobacter aminoxidans TaxID=186280 RepID=UPI003727360E
MRLELALRRRGLAVTPVDIALCSALATDQPAWAEEEIAQVFSAILAKGSADRALVREVCAALMQDHRGEVLPARPAGPSTTGAGPEQQHQDPPPSLWKRIYSALKDAWRPVTIVLLTAGFLAITAPFLPQLIEIIKRLLDPIIELPPPGDQLEVWALIVGGVVSSGLTALSVWLWRRYRGEQKPVDTPDGHIALPAVRPSIDDTVFRVGSLGGAPPTFLGEPYRGDIAGMLGYRASSADQTRIDFSATFEAQIREADPSLLMHPALRELPTILILVDREAEGLDWNTLDLEFAALLAQRGISHVCIEYPASFHKGMSRTARPLPEAVAIMDVLAAPGWTVSVLIGEAHRMSARDVDLLKTMHENGPLVFLELRDPALWDTRHRGLIRAGIDLRPATAEGLRDAIARIFAPHRGSRGSGASGGAKVASQKPSDTMDGQLDGAHLNWASDCALVEPVSFALAEKLRERYGPLRSPLPNLAFSRLVALPGSWLGPEGLRFEPSVRRRLQNHFAARPRGGREETLRILEEAFKEAGKGLGLGAGVMHRYALAAARFVGLTSEAAWRELHDLRRTGTMAQGVVDNLLVRVRSATGDRDEECKQINIMGGRETIILGDEPDTAALRDWLDSSRRMARKPGDGDTEERVERRFARWQLSVPDARIIYPLSSFGAQWAGEARPFIGGFLTGGRYLLVSGPPSEGRRVSLIDLFAAAANPLPDVSGERGLMALATAAEASMAVGMDDMGRLLTIVPEGRKARSSEGFGSRSINPGSGWPGSVIAVSHTGQVAWVGQGGHVVRLGLSADGVEGETLLPLEWQNDHRVSALCAESETGFLAGSTGGTVVRFRAGERFSIELARFDGEVVALASSAPRVGENDSSSQPGQSLLAVALADGRLILSDGSSSVEHRLPGRAARIALWRDRACFATREGDSERTEEHGHSIAVQFEDGGFDICGMPAPSDPARFTPLSLLDERVLPGSSGPRVIALGSQTRRVAFFERDRIVVRTLIYRKPVAAIAQRRLAQTEASA